MKNKKNKFSLNFSKLLSLGIFLLLVLNVPTNKTLAEEVCFDNRDCTIPCNKCSSQNGGPGICIPMGISEIDPRCGIINGISNSCFNGQCKPDCQLNGGTCKNPCSDGIETINSNLNCVDSHNQCCFPTEDTVLDDDIDFDPIDITIGDIEINSGLTAQENRTQNVLFKGVDCFEYGNCKVEDMMQTAINVTTFLLGIIGSVALLFFIFAGFKLLTSRGNEQAISSGKQMMVQTVIGIFIFFSAFLIIDFTRQSLLKPEYATPLGDPYEVPGTQEVEPTTTPPVTATEHVNTDINCVCKSKKGPEAQCINFGAGATINNTTFTKWDLRSLARRAGCSSDSEKWCPGGGFVICCPQSNNIYIEAGVPYAGNSTCDCDTEVCNFN